MKDKEILDKMIEEVLLGMEALTPIGTKKKKKPKNQFSYKINKVISKLMSYDFNSKCCIEENVNIKDLRIASILDEFSFNCYKEDLNLYPLDKDNYMKQLKTIKPHILFVESAWNSYQGGFRVSVDLKKIVRMIYYKF